MTTATIQAPATFHQFITTNFEKDQLADMAKYGANTGYAGLTYSSDLYDLFEAHEEEIWEILEDAGLFFSNFIEDGQQWSMQQVREPATWAAAEIIAQQITETF